MLRFPQNRRAQIQIALILGLIALFGGAIWRIASYLDETERNAALQEAVVSNNLELARQ